MRPTKKMTTSSGVEVEYKAYLTGRERRDIQNVFMKGVEINVEGKSDQKVKASLANEAQDKTIQTLIVSVDGKNDDVLNAVLDLPSKDFDEIIDAINNLDTDKKK